MEIKDKKIIKAVVLELRHLLEGKYDTNGRWHPGDLEQRLAAIGIRRKHNPVPIDELPHLSPEDKRAREVVDAYLALRQEAGIQIDGAVREFVRETAYTWANRLLALRCMEARELIDEVILQKEVYGGRSLEHHRLAQRQPELCTGEDDGLFAVFDNIFEAQAKRLPLLFDPKAPGVALRPSPAALKDCIGLLSLNPDILSRYRIKISDNQSSNSTPYPLSPIPYTAPDALGWAYQYWNTEEKDRVFEKVRTQKGAKIEGADIIPATQLYTEPYMVKFLVQNSLGALWMEMHPDSKLYEQWEYYVRDADRAPVEQKSVREITFLDPACGSGHFLLEAFDLFYTMYEEEGKLTEPKDACRSILETNLFGIDIDERAVQIAEAALWMKAAEKAFDFQGACINLVASNIHLPEGKDHFKAFLKKHPEDEQLRPALELIFEGLAHADELGSLLQIEEQVEKELQNLKSIAVTQKRKGIQQRLWTPTVVQGELPIGIESYEEWKKKAIERLGVHFNAEAITADLVEGFFSRSAGRGLSLFDLLARRYDVVAANPPYMGSKNMGEVLKNYVKSQYLSSKRDLYTSFIIRCCQLCSQNGYISLITLHTFITSRSFIGVRQEILKTGGFSSFVHLGTGTLKSLSNPNAQGFCMYVISRSNLQRATNREAVFIRLLDCDDKDVALLNALNMSSPSNRVYRRNSQVFSNLQECQFIYWIGKNLLNYFSTGPKLADIADVPKGLSTGENGRFLRYHWEAPFAEHWKAYAKGGGYRKWHGLQWHTLNWNNNGFLIKNLQDKTGYIRSRVQNERFYKNEGYTYTEVANSSFGVRTLAEYEFFDARSPSIFPVKRTSKSLLAVLNSRICTFLFRCISPGIMLDQAYAPSLPLPKDLGSKDLSDITEIACCIKQKLSSFQIEERSFGVSIPEIKIMSNLQWVSEAELLLVEGLIEELVIELYGISREDKKMIMDETGMPTAWFPLIKEYDLLPQLPDILPKLSPSILDYLANCKRLKLSPLIFDELRQSLYGLFEAGPGAKHSKELNKNLSNQPDEGEEDIITGAHIPIPSESFLEELSQKLEIHPISVYWLLKEGIEKEGWRCLPEERRITADRFTVMILRLLGHRWPKQIEAGELVPEWAIHDGVIPLTEGTNEPTLLARMRERIAAEFKGGDMSSIEREFAEIMGKPLGQWLETEFFKHHTKQFKKRPIAWQIQSSSFTKRLKPAFACLLYYHKVDGDILPKIRNQYIGPLRQRFETELRGIENIPLDARSDRQEKRRLELQDLILELKDFDLKLQKTSTEGFACKKLIEIIKKEPLDKWGSIDGIKSSPVNQEGLLLQEQSYIPDINDGVRVNIVPLQKAGLLASDVLAKKDIDKAIEDRAEWRADERRWCREEKLPQPGWWMVKD